MMTPPPDDKSEYSQKQAILLQGEMIADAIGTAISKLTVQTGNKSGLTVPIMVMWGVMGTLFATIWSNAQTNQRDRDAAQDAMITRNAADIQVNRNNAIGRSELNDMRQSLESTLNLKFEVVNAKLEAIKKEKSTGDK